VTPHAEENGRRYEGHDRKVQTAPRGGSVDGKERDDGGDDPAGGECPSNVTRRHGSPTFTRALMRLTVRPFSRAHNGNRRRFDFPHGRRRLPRGRKRPPRRATPAGRDRAADEGTSGGRDAAAARRSAFFLARARSSAFRARISAMRWPCGISSGREDRAW